MINRYTVKELMLDEYHPYNPNTLVFKLYDRKLSCYGFSYYFTQTEAKEICERKNKECSVSAE